MGLFSPQMSVGLIIQLYFNDAGRFGRAVYVDRPSCGRFALSSEALNRNFASLPDFLSNAKSIGCRR